MYEPPRDILFVGGFDEAKVQAASEGKWLVSIERGGVILLLEVFLLSCVYIYDVYMDLGSNA
jgi:hypothetical protein